MGGGKDALARDAESADFANYFYSYAELDHQKQMLEDERWANGDAIGKAFATKTATTHPVQLDKSNSRGGDFSPNLICVCTRVHRSDNLNQPQNIP